MRKQTMLISFIFAGLAIAVVQTSLSMPNFARRHNMSCSSCHNPVPRLNEFGFKFRAAGFRLPDEIGKGETSNNVGDYIAARTQARYDFKSSDPGTPGSSVTTTNQITFHEITFYPITGAFTKNLSSLVEMSFLPEEPAELENGYIRYNVAMASGFLSVRGGIFHPFEGYGASDRPLGLARPLIQTTAAKGGNTSTQFKPWGYDEVGIEAGYTMEKTSVRLTVFNGITSGGHPAQVNDPTGANAFAKASSDPSYNSKDFQLLATHMLTDNGGGVTGYAYFGTVDLGVGASKYANTFQRYALYASYPVQKFLVLGAFQRGGDQPDKASGLFNLSSQGFYGEANYNLSEPLWFGLRVDSFDPNIDVNDNEITAFTAVANYALDSGLQFIGEFQNKSTKKSSTVTQSENSFQVRMIFIF